MVKGLHRGEFVDVKELKVCALLLSTVIAIMKIICKSSLCTINRLSFVSCGNHQIFISTIFSIFLHLFFCSVSRNVLHKWQAL